MTMYFVRRLLLFIPSLFIISLLAFAISASAPGDPVSRLAKGGNEGPLQSSSSTLRAQQQMRERLGLNLPLFYFSVASIATPDTLHRIPEKSHRQALERLVAAHGNWNAVKKYYLQLKTAYTLNEQLLRQNPKDPELLQTSLIHIQSLLQSWDPVLIRERLQLLKNIASQTEISVLYQSLDQSAVAFESVLENEKRWQVLVPMLHWHGFRNQYHRWMFGDGQTAQGIVRGDFGISYRDHREISSRLPERFWWSFILAFFAVVLAYSVSLPAGMFAAYYRDRFADRGLSMLFFGLYSLPNFFAGTLLLVLFANPEVFDWFPVSGVNNPVVFDSGWPLWKRALHSAPYLVLPVITYAYGSFAFLSRQMRAAMVDTLQQEYIITARAKGLNEWKVVTKHALKNSLLPIITLFANVFPAAIAGSVIVETIFSIPGMGLEIYQSILNHDYPMVVAIFTLTGFLTLSGYLLADILYVLADPRISYSNPR
ncbi:MAG: ABC transporter permease [Bacteroidia bacterium]